jgi:hypothetical protein
LLVASNGHQRNVSLSRREAASAISRSTRASCCRAALIFASVGSSDRYGIGFSLYSAASNISGSIGDASTPYIRFNIFIKPYVPFDQFIELRSGELRTGGAEKLCRV